MPQIKHSFRHAFTMLELIFVIVILGIVSSIGAEVIAKTYEAYINQRALYKAGFKTELAATQLANRLAYAIPGSVVRRDTHATTLIDIKDPDNNTPVLQWIGYDVDSFTARDTSGTTAAKRRPGWSGFCDLSDSNRSGASTTSNINLSTPGSNLGLTSTIINNLSGTDSSITDAALYFPNTNAQIHNSVNAYTQAGADRLTVQKVVKVVPTTATIEITAPNAYTVLNEQYKLAWTSYAVVPVNDNNSTTNPLFDLELRYNFQPWNNIEFTADTVKKSILLRNVSVFRFTGSSNSIRFKLCVQERTGGTNANPVFVAVCKEKVVIR